MPGVLSTDASASFRTIAAGLRWVARRQCQRAAIRAVQRVLPISGCAISTPRNHKGQPRWIAAAN
jgi:ubiquinone/menaquinone biosynthesis C-methylase UbiE